MAFGSLFSGSRAKFWIAAAAIAILVFLMYPKFKPHSDQYENEGYVEDMEDEGYEDGGHDAMDYMEGFGNMDSEWASLQPVAKAQAALQSAQPGLPGVNIATDLLPKPALAQADWAEFAPKALGAQNFVDATAFIGVNTQGSALKNGNYQLRADIPIPRIDVGPWNNSTIESGDLSRKPLE